MSISLMAEFNNPLLAPSFLEKHSGIKNFTERYSPKSDVRKTLEQLLCVFAHGSVKVRDGNVAVNTVEGITATRDALQKKATYILVDKTVHDVLKEGVQDKEAFEVTYKNYIKTYVGDACDVIFRGIKYLNDSTKKQTFLAYIKDDLAPYLAKKKVVMGTQWLLRRQLERIPYGDWVAGAYDLACYIPLFGTELEELPRMTLEFLYDHGLQTSKQLITKAIEHAGYNKNCEGIPTVQVA